ncbi:MAG: hypothetical protein CK426_07185 [Legionella sp.]|nr:MAG: hypothetical protein CK423_04405 [Legionella sp.]PJD98006.1 MAG: hypothetical protein CK426_07185 [Legionella sp.]
MQFTDYLTIPGEHALLLEGNAGVVEAHLTVPQGISPSYVALLGHPHSLQGGTMNNKVVTTMARVFKELNIPSLRFNFRGVGQSAGVYDAGLGESDDLSLFMQQWQEQQPEKQFIFAGFSFGSYVAYRAASRCPQAVLITVAPPVHHYDYEELEQDLSSWLIVQGDEDEVVPFHLVEQFVKQAPGPVLLLTFTQTSHFFHGKLIELKTALTDYLNQTLGLV